MKIGVLSDTHGFLDERVLEHFKACDEIWHAGDWGSYSVVEQLQAFKPVRGVYGNIDSHDVRLTFPQHNHFELENMRIWLTHIGGYPNNYDFSLRSQISRNPPDLFICGHSHILKVMYDKKLNLLHINPGAAGKYGFQSVPTIVRFSLENRNISDLEVIELTKKEVL